MVRRKSEVRRAAFAQLCTIVLWLVSCFHNIYALKIVKVDVPEIIQYGVHDAVVLDCDYVYGNNTSGLVVKWFFRNKTRPVYQWIPSQKPQDMDILRGRVDLTYRVSNDPYKMHRAVKIVKPGTDISGDYTCVVSTFLAEDQRTKQMIVFVPQTHFRLIQNKTDDETVNVICAADGTFPAPNLTIATPERRLDNVKHSLKMIGGRYSAVASVTLRDADLPSPAEFICTLRIPQANYVVRKEAIYYPGALRRPRPPRRPQGTQRRGYMPPPRPSQWYSKVYTEQVTSPMSTTPEMPTAADMQLAAAVGSRGTDVYSAVSILLLPAALAQMLTL